MSNGTDKHKQQWSHGIQQYLPRIRGLYAGPAGLSLHAAQEPTFPALMNSPD
jgi:hypothetical protein